MRFAIIKLLGLSGLIIMAVNLWAAPPTASTDATSSSEPAGLIIKFKGKPESRARFIAGGSSCGVASADAINRRFGITEVRELTAEGTRLAPTHPFYNVVTISGKDVDLNSLREQYAALPEVEYAELDRFFHLDGPPGGPIPEPDPVPNDPLYIRQWHLKNGLHHAVRHIDGPGNDIQTLVQGLARADINADSVFKNPPTGGLPVVVAVIDYGIDFTHPDLNGSVWTNPDDSTQDGADNDHNGFIDDAHGWDFGPVLFRADLEDNDPTDPHGHGTHVSGIIGARSNNWVGVAGICPNVKIMPVKVFPYAVASNIAKGLVYAADNGADVINMSFGSTVGLQIIEDAVRYASDAGVTLCASSGNKGDDAPSYPAAFEQVIAVGATNDSDYVTPFSSFGNHVDLVAPGNQILSLRATGTDMYNTVGEPNVHVVQSSYYLSDGTSMASPMVAGAAAYLRSLSPGLSPDSIQQILQTSAKDLLDPYHVGANLVGWDQYSGYGRLDLKKSLTIAPRTVSQISSPQPYAAISGSVTISGKAGGTPYSGYTLEFGEGASPLSWTTISASSNPVNGVLGNWNTTYLNGLYTIRLRVGVANSEQVLVWVLNETAANVSAPSDNDTVNNFIAITGNARCPDFREYSLEYHRQGDPAGEWSLVSRHWQPAFDASLGTWIPPANLSGLYLVRLLVYNQSGTAVSGDTIQLHLTGSIINWAIPLGAAPSIMCNYGDFDGDGINEIIVPTSTGVKFFSPDGTEITTGMPAFPTGEYVVPFAVGDLDGDSEDDCVGYNNTTGELVGYRSSDGMFGGQANNAIPNPPMLTTEYSLSTSQWVYLAISDMNGDGQNDVVMHNRHDLFPVGICWYRIGDQVAQYFRLVTDSQVYNWFTEYCVADLDGNDTSERCGFYEETGAVVVDRGPHLTVAIPLQFNGTRMYQCDGMSAYDIDQDGQKELIVFGRIPDVGFLLYALDYVDNQLTVKDGWPHVMSTDNAPATYGGFASMPVFADIDNNGSVEYFSAIAKYTGSESIDYFIQGWNIDGSTIDPSGHALCPSSPVVAHLGPPMIADIDGDRFNEILSIGVNPIAFTPSRQYLFAWTAHGDFVTGYPKILSPSLMYRWPRYTPMMGDVDRNGTLDLLVGSSDSNLYSINFGVEMDGCHDPVTAFGYHRNFDWCGPSNPDTCAPVSDTCGDCNSDGYVDSLDVDYLADYLIGAGPAPVPYGVGDVNGSGLIDLTDLSWLVSNVETGLPLLQCSGLSFAGSNGSSALELSLSTKPVDSYERFSITTTSDIQLVTVTCGGISDAGEIKVLGDGSKVRFGHRGDTVVVLIRGKGVSPVCRKGTTALVDLPTGAVTYEVSAVDQSGRIATIRVGSAASESLPKEFALSANYPNPFNPNTTISFDVPKACDYTLVIYNTLGQQVTTFSGKAEPGTVRLTWDGARQASGVYFYRLIAGEFSGTRKMMLLK